MNNEESVEGEEAGNRVYTVKMKLFKPIPQFMPIAGRKLRIYYNDKYHVVSHYI